MQIPFKPVRQTKSGFALMTVMAFLAFSLLTFAYIMYLVCGNSKATSQNNLYNISQAAAEGATEMVVAQMNHDFLYQNLQDASVYAGMIPTNVMQTNNWPVQFQFSGNGVVNQISVTIAPLNYSTNWVTLYDPQFNGLYAAVANCTVAATATPVNQSYQTAATVSQVLQMASIPVFQFGVYYNMDMDLSPGSTMTMNGTTFVNGNLWMYPQASMTFNGSVEATLSVTNADDPNDQQNLTSYTTPTYNFTANGGKPLSKADAVSLPIGGPNSNPTNIESILNLPPAALAVPNAAGYQTTNLNSYLYNQAILIISNSVSGTNGNSVWGTNLSIFFDDSGAQTLTLLTNDLQWTNGISITTNCVTNPIVYKYYSFVTNVTFYDFREQDTVQAVQIDIAKFNIWLTNTATRLSGGTTNYVAGSYWSNLSFSPTDNNSGINSIYVYNSVSGNSATLPAVRLINGYQMPLSTNGSRATAGLTVVTPFPLYVLGNYNIQTNSGGSQSINTTNTAWTWPAALMGDAITILSGNWNDANSLTYSGSSYNNPSGSPGARDVTSNVTVNAACLEGIVPSTFTTHKQYSGGLENFLRLQEDWAGNTLCYNGSIVVMFPSIYATNFWIGPSDRSGYPNHNYTVPTRKWGFDANFQTQSKLPPMTPQVKTMIRGQWTR